MSTSGAVEGLQEAVGGRAWPGLAGAGRVRPGLAGAAAGFLVVYGCLYVAWQQFRWGGPDLELVIADFSFIPLGIAVVGFGIFATRHAGSPAARRAWAVISLAFLAFLFGDLAWFWIEVVQQQTPYPSIADVGYLGFFPILLLGLFLLPRETAENPFRAILDLAIVGIGAATVVWWLVLEPMAASSGASDVETLVALAYPVGDLLVLFALAAALMSRLVGVSRLALTFLSVGVLLNVVADLFYARASLDGSYESGAWLDVCYVIGWVALGLAAYAQARYTAAAREARATLVAARPISYPPYVALAAVYVALLVGTELQGSSVRTLVAGAILVTSLVVVRQVVTARENARLLADRASSRSAARFQAIIQNASDVFAVVDPHGTIAYVTPSVARLVGRPAEDLLGRNLDSLVEPEDAPLVLEMQRTALARSGTGDTIECRVRTEAGAVRHVDSNITNLLDDPNVEGLVVTMRDATDRHHFEDQLRDQAFHDPLTGLANRALLADRIDQAVRRSRRRGVSPGLLYLDLDDFKSVNDTLGHPVGDAVLVEVARRIEGAIRAEDTAARLGGDEFAVLLDETRSVEDQIAVAERILADLRTPVEVEGTTVPVAASVGIVRPEARSTGSVDLLRDADIAMYEAKREARGSYRLFEPSMFAATVERLSLEADLRAALDAGQFEVVYQPLFHLVDRSFAGVEALLRWNHPLRGLVMPTEFIPIAERTGDIVPIGRWVIEQACTAVRDWAASDGLGHLAANVNVSARQLEPRLVEDVADILRRTAFPADRLVLEITESVFAAERPGVMEILTSLRALGLRVSIDDFGTGYSSLSMLRDLPVDELKIDRTFIRDSGGEQGSSIVDAIIRMSHELGLSTVAEGIEIEEQAAAMRALGCDTAQGYLLGRPAPADAITQRIQDGFQASGEPLARSA
jgi:diguanylate cyclase (GGDEF)-like protein/PAS domain S-box-containing protein